MRTRNLNAALQPFLHGVRVGHCVAPDPPLTYSYIQRSLFSVQEAVTIFLPWL